jgi:hypothetical protein
MGCYAYESDAMAACRDALIDEGLSEVGLRYHVAVLQIEHSYKSRNAAASREGKTP